MRKRLTDKLRSIAGETLVESLVAMLIIVFVFAFLVNAALVAAKINHGIDSDDVAIDYTKAEQVGSVNVTIAGQSMDENLYVIKGNDGEARYYCYGVEPSA